MAYGKIEVDQIESSSGLVLETEQITSELKALSLALNCEFEQVIYSTDITTELDDVLYINDTDSQLTYIAPTTSTAGETIASFNDGVLVSSTDESYTLSAFDSVASVSNEVATNTADIATNTADIATNTDDIATNTDDISTINSVIGGVSGSVTGAATFDNATQAISMTGVGAIAGLEVGDALKIDGSDYNDGVRTVEGITGSGEVVVNYEHRGQTTAMALVDETATSGVTITLLCKWYNAGGLGQGWCVPTSGRTSLALEENSTNRAIQVAVGGSTIGANGGVKLTIDSANFGYIVRWPAASTTCFGNSWTIGDGSEYSLEEVSFNMAVWEWR